jgi:hypothetical protein
VWAVHGLLLWVQPAPSPYASLKTNPALPTASTIEALVAASQTIGFPNR